MAKLGLGAGQHKDVGTTRLIPGTNAGDSGTKASVSDRGDVLTLADYVPDRQIS